LDLLQKQLGLQKQHIEAEVSTDIKITIEDWGGTMKDVVGYEGLYGITSCGKVWSYKT
jgi:hypothetical protein